MYACTYLETKVLNTFRGTTATPPANLFVGLFFSSPGETGTDGSEVNYGSYQRQAITFNAPATINSYRTIRNSTEITFPTAATAVGRITHLGIFDSQTRGSGNCYLYGEFTDPPNIDANEAPVIVASELSFWVTGNFSNAFADDVLNLMRGNSITGFTSYAALFKSSSGSSEMSGDTYERQRITFGAPTKSGSGSRIQNTAQLATARSTVAWGTWAYTNIMDGPVTQANTRIVATLERTPPKETKKGMKIIWNPNQLAVQFN